MKVAIVGRPNVGKSTLFNRIVRRRIAITLKEPGTTRDRIRAESHWGKTKFTLIDTGGFTEEKTTFTEQINFQIGLAIKEAGIIIFLVDGSTPPTAQDFAITELLRKAGRPFILAVNKTDKKDTRDYQHEFYKLGVEELFPISAEHGIGVDLLLDEVVKDIMASGEEEKPAIPPLRLLIVGRPNVGKSLFLNCLLNEERVIVSEKPGTTRDAIEEEFTFDDKKFKIIDTAGLRKKPRVKESVEYFSVQRVLKFIPSSNVVVLILDAITDSYPPVALTGQDKHIIQLILNRGKGMVIAINKIDLIPHKERKDLLNNTKLALRNFNFIPVVMTSALKNDGIIETIRKAEDVYEAGSKKIEDAVIAETVLSRMLEKPPSSRARSLKLVQSGVLPPRFDLITNAPKAIIESYKRFVIKEIRSYFGFMGYLVVLKVKSKP